PLHPVRPPPWYHFLVRRLFFLLHLYFPAVARDLRLYVLVPDEAVIGTRHQLRLADAVQQVHDAYPAILDVYDPDRSRGHLLDDDRLRLETRRELKRIVADRSVRRPDRGQRQSNRCDDFLDGRAAC